MVFWRGLVVTGVGLLMGGAAGVRVEAQRLPGGVRPEHYSLKIRPDLVAATFSGSETIEVVLDAATNAITLNAAEIEFGSVSAYVLPAGGQRQEQLRGKQRTKTNTGVLRSAQDDGVRGGNGQSETAVVTLDAAKEQATFTFARALPAGRVVLAIEYRGILNDKLRGFYLSKTKARSYGVTQFEATDARRALPCFDEPALKATFNVTLVVDAGDTAISNTKLVSDTPGPGDGRHTLVFATTPKMSTYLVAWLVGDFACSEGKSDGVPIRACSTPDKVKLTKFALDAAKWNLHYYDKYFGIKYPMAKLDLIAIPDFEAGAMENFGCITYRETEMLVDAKNGAVSAKKEVAETIAHEMSHQWFGDMVTMQWWDNLWLNEGFATWMESKAATTWHPEWEFDQDVATELDATLDEDAQATTRAIRARAETPAEIEEMFDDIAYGKAGAVIGMVENWVGEEVFRKGVHEYLAAHLYGNATAEDFWSAQTRTSGLAVDTVMRSFVEQPGVPLVTLGAGAGGGSLPVAQQRFLLAGGGAAVAGRDEMWTVPVCFKGTSCRLMTPETRMMEGAGTAPFVYANAGDKGYYRTKYADGQLAAVVANAESGLTPPERIGVLGDRWALMRGGEGSVGEFLDLALAVKTDTNAAVLDNALGKMELVDKMIATDEDRKRLDGLVLREFGPMYAGLGAPVKHEGWEKEELRGTLFGALGQAGDPAVLERANKVADELFSGHKIAKDSGDLSIADAAVALAAQKGDAAMYDKLMALGQNARDPDLKEEALHLLTRFQDPLLVIRTLRYAVSDEARNQDSWALIALLLTRRPTQDLAWQFVQQHWPEIEKKATESSEERIVEGAGGFCSVERRDDVVSFFAAHPVPSAERTLAKSIDSINDCIHLRAAQEPELRKWLDVHPTR
jgi:aminopeptidase N/puromycin-sensitive aminopeptidase